MDMAVMQKNAELAAELLRTLSNPARLLVLCALVSREHTAGELEELVGLSQSAVSQHLAKLRKQSIVTTRREGQKIYYALHDPHSKSILEVLYQIYCAQPE
ncbi:winged helix-turn-helix transcriptional regulator [Aestuariicella hydrocarbonica]|uniref:Winged helix-turn-helix transcriptional regulator n=2 Tax=Pseudomaricurvus hydrocarbonicus TaxID=1470433 RepID=A0A9E5MM03_9GAMM|nr:winged helix-turn-helix transcriptional regulator [Aestuariicella hydrocarbonica]